MIFFPPHLYDFLAPHLLIYHNLTHYQISSSFILLLFVIFCFISDILGGKYYFPVILARKCEEYKCRYCGENKTKIKLKKIKRGRIAQRGVYYQNRSVRGTGVITVTVTGRSCCNRTHTHTHGRSTVTVTNHQNTSVPRLVTHTTVLFSTTRTNRNKVNPTKSISAKYTHSLTHSRRRSKKERHQSIISSTTTTTHTHTHTHAHTHTHTHSHSHSHSHLPSNVPSPPQR